MADEENMVDYDAADYRRTRWAYRGAATTQYFVGLLATDAFFAKLLTSMGISDAFTGIISSFVSVAFLIQLMTFMLMKINTSEKKLVIIFETTSIFMFMSLYLIPFLPAGQRFREVVLVVCVCLAYGARCLVSNIYYTWAQAYVDPGKRARFGAGTEMVSLASGLIFTMVMGAVIDKFESLGNLEGGFLFVSVSILIINICNFIFLMLMKDRSREVFRRENKPTADIVRNTLGKKTFRNVMVMSMIWYTMTYTSIGFMGTFKTNELGMSLLLVQIANMLGSAGKLFCSKPFGKYSDKHSFAKGFELAMHIVAAAFLINIFTTEKTWYLVVVFTVLYNCGLAGTNHNATNMLYSYVEPDYVVHAMTIMNCVSGVWGFIVAIGAGVILEKVQKNNDRVFGIHMYGQQLLSLISFAAAVLTIIYVRKVIEKQRVIAQ